VDQTSIVSSLTVSIYIPAIKTIDDYNQQNAIDNTTPGSNPEHSEAIKTATPQQQLCISINKHQGNSN